MKQRGLRHIAVLYNFPQPRRVAPASHLKKIKFPHNVFETRPSTRHPYPALQTNKIISGPPPSSKILGSAHVRPMDKANWKNTCSNKGKGVLRVNKCRHDTDIHVHYRYKSIWLYIHSSLHIGSLVDGIDKTYITCTFVVIWPQSLKLTVSLKNGSCHPLLLKDKWGTINIDRSCPSA